MKLYYLAPKKLVHSFAQNFSEWHAEHLEDDLDHVLLVARFAHEVHELTWSENTPSVLAYPHLLTNGPSLHLEHGVTQQHLDIMKRRYGHVEREPVFSFMLKVGKSRPSFRPTVL